MFSLIRNQSKARSIRGYLSDNVKDIFYITYYSIVYAPQELTFFLSAQLYMEQKFLVNSP